ncbi:MAG: CIA30 family protein [Spirochaetes bacterium]|nr:CIA30 family protein [Spirochaetota bacterium]
MKYIIGLLAISMTFPLNAQDLVLADFQAGLFSAPDWTWQGFADRVMGGRSDLVEPGIVNTPDGLALRLAGKVVTKGGGFIQVRLENENGRFDATAYAGIELVLSAPPGGSYYAFLRTKDNVFPWSYYGALLELDGSLQTLRLPWSAFKPESALRRTPRVQYMESIALVAAYLDFEPNLKIYRAGLYR